MTECFCDCWASVPALTSFFNGILVGGGVIGALVVAVSALRRRRRRR